jgi:tetratricopeptide (TPR) repeat protein
MSDDTDSLYKTAVQHFREARKPDAYLEVMREFASLLSDPKNLPVNNQFSCRFLIAICEKNLHMLDGAKSRLQELLKDIQNDHGENNGLIQPIKLALAEIFRDIGDWEEAIRMFDASAEQFRVKGDRLSEVNVYLTVANIWANQNNLKEADAALIKAWAILQYIPESPLHVQVLFTRGHYHHLYGDPKSAIDLEEHALAVAKRLGDMESELTLTHNLAKFTFNINDYRRSEQYHQKLLDIARTDNKKEEIIDLMVLLGTCYTETGQSRKAIECIDEVLSLLSYSSSVRLGVRRLLLILKATALVDMKKHAEASELLIQARKLRDISEDRLIDDLEKRIARESKAPLSVDCSHRVIHMAFGDVSEFSPHINPFPSSKVIQADTLSLELTNNERKEFEKTYMDVQRIAQSTQQPEGNNGAPKPLEVRIKILYVDDPFEFGKKWRAFVQEKNNKTMREKIQVKWTEIENKKLLSKGVPYDDSFGYLTYITDLTDLAHLCAASKNKNALREVSLYTADFLESSTNDQMVALIVWCTRARLLASVLVSALPECKELLEMEISYSYEKAQEVFSLLDPERRKVCLNIILHPWFLGAKLTRNKKIYRRLAEITGENFISLSPDQKILYGIALCESGDFHEGEKNLHFITDLEKTGSISEQELSPQIRKFIAINRLKILNPDFESCKSTYGPFSSWIYDNISEQEKRVDIPFEDEIFLPSHFPLLVFTCKNLAVFKKVQHDPLSKAAITFVLHNQAHSNRQMLRTDDGFWLVTLRDAPCTHALMFSELYNGTNKDDPPFLEPEITNLISTGYDCVVKDPRSAGLYIMNTCHYFEQWKTDTTDISYACGAILLGMAYGFLQDKVAVNSYLAHLQIVDHENALIYGKKRAVLQF